MKKWDEKEKRGGERGEGDVHGEGGELLPGNKTSDHSVVVTNQPSSWSTNILFPPFTWTALPIWHPPRPTPVAPSHTNREREREKQMETSTQTNCDDRLENTVENSATDHYPSLLPPFTLTASITNQLSTLDSSLCWQPATMGT